MKVVLKRGARIKTDANTVFKELEASKVDGHLDLATVVDRARSVDSPIHSEFTWDDHTAAEQWRLEEARYLVRAIEVVYDQAETKAVRAYESIPVRTATDDSPTPVTRTYQHIEDVLADPVARSELLTRAMREAAAWRRRYATLQELAQVHAAIDAAVLTNQADAA